MKTRVVAQTTESTWIFPLGVATPNRPPDIELTLRPDIELVQNFMGLVMFQQKDDVMEHTTWIESSDYHAHRIKERYRLWIDGQHDEVSRQV